MSRILRRPMFRGGPASSEGVGITSGLNNPRQGYAGGTDNQGVQSNDDFMNDIFMRTIYGDNYDSQNTSNVPVQETADERRARQRDESNREIRKYNQGLNKEQEAPTTNIGINPATGLPFKPTSPRERLGLPLTIAQQMEKEGIKTEGKTAAEKIKMEKEFEEKLKNKKIDNSKLSIESNYETEKPTINRINNSQTLKQDIDTYTKLLMENAGSDKDEYTRQKYLTLAKFGLNLLKPTPVGIKPSLATSLASAAEKPLEEYGNISMQQSKEDRALRQAAVQLGIQKHMPGTIAKGIQDLMAMNPNMSVEEATSIVTTQKNAAALAKEKFNEVIQKQKDIEELINKDASLKKISKINPNLITDYAKIAVEQGLYNSELKGYYKDYNTLREGSIYFAEDKQTGELVPHKSIKGKLYSIREPEFKKKGI